MKVCIAGGGKVGYFLAKSLISHGHHVTIIEPDEARCRYLADALDIAVECGNAIHVDALQGAGCDEADSFVAVTGSDEDNLVACQLAKQVCGVKKTTARVSDPKNRPLLQQLGVDIVVCGTDNLGNMIEREIETDAIRQVLSLAGGTASLNEVLLPEGFIHSGCALSELKIPGDAILISVTRGSEFIIPHGSTRLYAGDRVLCLMKDDALHLLAEAWGLAAK